MESTLTRLFEFRGYPAEFPVKTLCVPALDSATLERFISAACADAMVKLVVLYETCTVSNKKLVFFRTLCDLELFEGKYLALLLDGHRLLAPHEKLEGAARAEFLAHYAEENLPVLSVNDPMARLHDFKVGDVVQIRRPRGVYFRIVRDC